MQGGRALQKSDTDIKESGNINTSISGGKERQNEPIFTNDRDKDSKTWPLNKINPKQILRVYHQNIRGAKPYRSWKRWTEGIKWLSDNGVGIAALTETNVNWNNKNKEEATIQARRVTNKVQVHTTSIKTEIKTDYLPGGTACLLMQNWTGRSMEKIEDDSGLGRWSGYKLRAKGNRTIIVLSDYRPTRSSDMGDTTCYSQQWRIMRETHGKNIEPRTKYIKDLKEKVKEWEQQGFEIIIAIDANEAMDNKNSQIKQLIDETTLLSLLETEPQIATYDRGTKCIDYIMGTPLIKQATKAAGYLPFYGGAWDSDHRALVLDIDIKILFGNLDIVDEKTNRALISKNKGQAIKFMKKLQANNKIDNLLEKLHHIRTIKNWSSDMHDTFESIDGEFTEILTKIEKECKNDTQTHWSLILHIARQTYRYWRIASKGKANRLHTRTQLEKLRQIATDPNAIWQGDRNRPIKNQLKRAICNLVEIERHSQDHRAEFLVQLHSKYKGENKEKKANIVRKVQKAERRTRCYTVCRNITKPRNTTGGLTHIIVNENTNQKRIEGRVEVENSLHQKNISHFSQAKMTPFANGEIATLFNVDGISRTTDRILENKEIRNVSDEMREMFKELSKKRETLSDYIPFQAMVEGIQKWRETTTTSPSGKHLGIYRTLTNALKGKYEESNTTTEKQKISDNKPWIQETAKKVLMIQHHILNLAVRHQHTLERWKTVHNVFLENYQVTL
jgi:hypothetical protein